VAKKRAGRVLAALGQSIPDARVELDSSNPLELLMATILSAQCTDERVNQATPKVFSRFRTAEDYAKADREELEALIRPTGFFKNKARHLIGCGQSLVKHFNGMVPGTMEALTSLPGVGRKTANVILGSYVGEPAIVVDTHVKRVANRLGLTKSQDPTKIEEDLQHLFPKAQWTVGAQRLLLHGRYVCLARRPNCQTCVLYADCGWEGKRKRT
jgi:endonuclease-3